MDLAAIFNKKVPNKQKLLKAGFEWDQKLLSKYFLIMNGEYKVAVHIPFDGQIRYQVFDAVTEEEYILVHVPDAIGAYVGKVREACETILVDIAAEYFDTELFKSQQTIRIVNFIQESLGIDAEYPWPKLPDYAVFRVAENQKWFAIIMVIDKSKLQLKGQGTVEIISVKNRPEQVAAYLKNGTFLEAYHMNKKHWLTIILDETVEDRQVQEMLQVSYDLVARK